MRLKFSAEAKTNGLVGKDIGAYVNAEVKSFKDDFIIKHKTDVEKRTKELEVLIPEAIKRSKKLDNLEACFEDAKKMTRFLIETLGIKPEHFIFMTTEPVFNKVVQIVKVY